MAEKMNEHTPQTPEAAPGQARLIDFETRRSLPAKLWMTFILILMGVIMLLPYLCLDQPAFPNSFWLKFGVKRLIEMIEIFVLSAMIFVWYRPPWVSIAYLKAERRVAWLVWPVEAAFVVLIILAGLRSAFGLLFGR